jgi:hypothetical protein
LYRISDDEWSLRMKVKVSGTYTRAYDFDTELDVEALDKADDAATQYLFDTFDNVDMVNVLSVQEI